MAVTYTEIVDAEIDPEAPITSFLAFRLRDNPEAMAIRAAGAPQVIPEKLDVLTGSGNFVVPAGVTRLRVTAVGGGGGANGTVGGGGGGTVIANVDVTPAQSIAFVVGGGGATDVDGVDTTFGALTADGGGKGSAPAGGGASGGDLNLTGSNGVGTLGVDFGGASAICAGPVEGQVGLFPGGGGGAVDFAGAAGTIILEY